MADWMLPKEESFPFIKKALEAGINFFDTADIYSRGESETILGEALKEYGARRDETVVATKVYVPMAAGPNRGGLPRASTSCTRSTRARPGWDGLCSNT